MVNPHLQFQTKFSNIQKSLTTFDTIFGISTILHVHILENKKNRRTLLITTHPHGQHELTLQKIPNSDLNDWVFYHKQKNPGV